MYESNAFPSIKGKYLFVGNAVPKFSGENGFYYLNNNNSFWKLLDYVFYCGIDVFEKIRKHYHAAKNDHERNSVKEVFLTTLKINRIGITDAISHCTNKSTSSDSAIIQPVYNEGLIELVKEADVVFINGCGATLKSFKKALSSSYSELSKCKPIIVLVSSSNAAAVLNKKEEWKKKVLPFIDGQEKRKVMSELSILLEQYKTRYDELPPLPRMVGYSSIHKLLEKALYRGVSLSCDEVLKYIEKSGIKYDIVR